MRLFLPLIAFSLSKVLCGLPCSTVEKEVHKFCRRDLKLIIKSVDIFVSFILRSIIIYWYYPANTRFYLFFLLI